MKWIYRLNNYGISHPIIILIFILSFISIVTQMIGLGVFIPIFQNIIGGELTQGVEFNDDPILGYVFKAILFFGFDVTLESLLIFAFLFYFLGQIFSFLISYITVYYQNSMVFNIKNRFFEYYLDADSSYYDKVKIGDFVNIVTTELGAAVVGVIAPIKLMVAIVSAIGSLAFLLYLSVELTFLVVLLMLFVVPLPAVLIKKSTALGEKNTRYNSLFVSFLLDRMRSPRLVRLSNTKSHEINAYSSITEDQRTTIFRLHVLKQVIGIVFEPLVVLISLLMLYIAVIYLGIESSIIMIFMVILVRMIPIMRSILNLKQSINRFKGPIGAIDNLLSEIGSTKKELSNDHISQSIKDSIGHINSIELDLVSYRYVNSCELALSNISLVFNSATSYAIVGPSGSGKSTLIDIISSYRGPTSGNILLDGVLVGEHQEKRLCDLISYVPQTPQIFDGSIIDHISYGVKTYSQLDVKKAAKLSGSYDFIERLDKGFDSHLKDNGGNLSGGQRFRLDLARALLRDAPILILDEPTSSLDHESKNSFVHSLEEIKNSTMKILIVITHDFSILPMFDNIIVMNEGAVIANGSHDDVLQTSEWYEEGVKGLK